MQTYTQTKNFSAVDLLVNEKTVVRKTFDLGSAMVHIVEKDDKRNLVILTSSGHELNLPFADILSFC